ncbi:fungal-specific transcription factor domain-containing protein [Chaetomium strumarium]|uniref:Fungal-specific transcription factor domain-containing protein n=1 Tax=Chaetomium strumarium TaxID=1170767 RepID=A0AAJ0LZY4_9PEZI|nr:fungal-specific transcription factor domain-containing protein [Chaetomium strumarium]
MPGTRSRQGCEECRRRRRKCDEQKPCCGQCSTFNRMCKYTLRLVWGRGPGRKTSLVSQVGSGATQADHAIDRQNETLVHRNLNSTVPAEPLEPSTSLLPRHLPNGIPLSPRYQRLLSYFAGDILASLSCHPSIHEDLRQGLVPVTLDSPQLMSACLALSAAGFLSRGVVSVDGVETPKLLGHLQSSGLALLRGALGTGQMNETLLATCLIWCLTDVFTYRQGTSSWRIHLQGIRALLDGDGAHRDFTTRSGPLQSAMRHLYQLYLSLRTLPYIPACEVPETSTPMVRTTETAESKLKSTPSPAIDGFLGYSDELLDIIHQIDQLSQRNTEQSSFEADILLGKVKAMIRRDNKAPPAISICSPLSPEYGREFTLCHQVFQQTTLIYLYRRLYHLPSGSPPIQSAVRAMEEMVSNMSQRQPCHTWVAMAMPLFTLGCEAFTEEQRTFALDKINKLEQCIRSLHVRIIRQALQHIWDLRASLGDFTGELCASQLLGLSSVLALIRVAGADVELIQRNWTTM